MFAGGYPRGGRVSPQLGRYRHGLFATTAGPVTVDGV
jgi:hypothetical protein